MSLLSWFKQFFPKKEYCYLLNISFEIENNETFIVYRFVEFIERLNLHINHYDSNGTYLIVIYSLQKIRRSKIDKIKKWFSIHGIRKYTISDLKKERI